MRSVAASSASAMARSAASFSARDSRATRREAARAALASWATSSTAAGSMEDMPPGYAGCLRWLDPRAPAGAPWSSTRPDGIPLLCWLNRAVRVLSIQSSVAYGHVGNSAAVFPLQRLGVEVWPILTVHFSNHTGYGHWRGPLLSAEDLREVLTGVEERGVLPGCDAVLSGYQGAQDVGTVVLDAVARVRAANPAAVYCCDPVLGDTGRGFFVRPGIPEFMRDWVIPAADIATPNHFA